MQAIQKSIIAYFFSSYLIFFTALFQQVSSISLGVIFGISLIFLLMTKHLQMNPSDMPALTATDRKALMLSMLAIMLAYSHVLSIPPYMRDDVIYHLLVPKQIVVNGGFKFDPFNINSNFPMAFEMPLTFSILSRGWIPPQLANYMALLGLCAAYYILAIKIFNVNRILSLSAIALIGTTPVVYDQVRSSYVELMMALLVLAAFYNYFLFQSHRYQSRYWYLSMLFMGFICAVKYIGGIYALFLIITEFFASRNRSQYYKGVLICIAACLPWYLKNWVLLGNPVFPLLNFLFQSEFISIERSIYYRHLFADYHVGKGVADYLLLPIRLLSGYAAPPISGQLGFGGKLSFFFICAFIAPLALCRRSDSEKYIGSNGLIGVLFIVITGIWAFTSQQVRFLLPVVILSSLVGLNYLNAYWSRFKIIIVAGICLIAFQNSANLVSIIKNEKIGLLVTGQISRDSFLDHHMPISYSLAKKVNRILDPQKHRLFTVGCFGRNYYFNVDVITNTYYEPEILARAFRKENVQPEILEKFIKKQKITHMLINHAYLQHFFSNDASFSMDALKDYLSHLTPILIQNAVVVYKINS